MGTAGPAPRDQSGQTSSEHDAHDQPELGGLLLDAGSVDQMIGAMENQKALMNRYSLSRVAITSLESPGSVFGPTTMPISPEAKGMPARAPIVN